MTLTICGSSTLPCSPIHNNSPVRALGLALQQLHGWKSLLLVAVAAAELDKPVATMAVAAAVAP
jgi:hypothetical protein